MAGPESGSTFCVAVGSGNCPAETGWYENWDDPEPNNSGGEMYAQILAGGSGRWNDLRRSELGIYQVHGYIVEYGGLPGDSPADVSGTVTVTVQQPPPPSWEYLYLPVIYR